MKKSFVLFLTFVLAVSVICNGFAASSPNRIYADTVTVEAGESVTVPVKIENNDGFMGFSITVTYDADALAPVSVSKSSMLKGLFNDSIETSTDNSFKVVYTGTGNMTDNGELFVITFDVADSASGKHEIDFSYSPQDTFNENWDNIVFNCEKVEMIVTVNGTTAAETTVPTTQNTEQSTTSPNESETTTMPEESTTEPVTEPSTEPEDEEKPLSVRMREWVNGLPFPLNIILGIFVIPVSYIVAIFE